MADTRLYAQAQSFTLAVGISTSDTSITLTSFNFPDGSAIAAGDIGTVAYGTLEAGTSREESISFTGFTTNADSTVTLTGVTRGLGFGAGDSYSEQSDLKVQHGAGAKFILSNTAAFYNDFVNKGNDETITGTLSVPTPTAAGHAATKAYVDQAALGGITVDQVVVDGTAGESVAAGDLVYFDDTDNEWKKTDADNASTLDNVILGIAQGAGSDGGGISGGILTSGVDANQTGLTAGVKLYASNTAGEIAESAGTNEKVIGWSKSATEVYFDPYHGALPSGGEKAALAGGGDLGTPSSSNKYVTEDFISAQTAPVIEVFESSGTWTKDAGLKYIVVEGVGGGGGGDGDVSGGAPGGGGGGYFKKIISASLLSSTEIVTVGAGGGGVETGIPGNGGNTSFGSFATANGGQGGTNASATATGGDVNIGGGYPGDGHGGDSQLGGAGKENNTPGSGYGGGGGGGNSGNRGGDGADGVVIVTEYYS